MNYLDERFNTRMRKRMIITVIAGTIIGMSVSLAVLVLIFGLSGVTEITNFYSILEKVFVIALCTGFIGGVLDAITSHLFVEKVVDFVYKRYNEVYRDSAQNVYIRAYEIEDLKKERAYGDLLSSRISWIGGFIVACLIIINPFNLYVDGLIF